MVDTSSNFFRKDLVMSPSEATAISKNLTARRRLNEELVGLKVLRTSRRKAINREIHSMYGQMQHFLDGVSKMNTYSQALFSAAEIEIMEQEYQRNARSRCQPRTQSACGVRLGKLNTHGDGTRPKSCIPTVLVHPAESEHKKTTKMKECSTEAAKTRTKAGLTVKQAWSNDTSEKTTKSDRSKSQTTNTSEGEHNTEQLDVESSTPKEDTSSNDLSEPKGIGNTERSASLLSTFNPNDHQSHRAPHEHSHWARSLNLLPKRNHQPIKKHRQESLPKGTEVAHSNVHTNKRKNQTAFTSEANRPLKSLSDSVTFSGSEKQTKTLDKSILETPVQRKSKSEKIQFDSCFQIKTHSTQSARGKDIKDGLASRRLRTQSAPATIEKATSNSTHNSSPKTKLKLDQRLLADRLMKGKRRPNSAVLLPSYLTSGKEFDDGNSDSSLEHRTQTIETGNKNTDLSNEAVLKSAKQKLWNATRKIKAISGFSGEQDKSKNVILDRNVGSAIRKIDIMNSLLNKTYMKQRTRDIGSSIQLQRRSAGDDDGDGGSVWKVVTRKTHFKNVREPLKEDNNETGKEIPRKDIDTYAELSKCRYLRICNTGSTKQFYDIEADDYLGDVFGNK